jgi:hypothetical protein
MLPVLRSRSSAGEKRRMVYGGSWPVATLLEADVGKSNRRRWLPCDVFFAAN